MEDIAVSDKAAKTPRQYFNLVYLIIYLVSSKVLFIYPFRKRDRLLWPCVKCDKILVARW